MLVRQNQHSYADIILPLSVEGMFTYAIPKDLVAQIDIGSRVLVPLGKRKFYTGVVAVLHSNEPSDYVCKEIVLIWEDLPSLLPLQIQFWQWMSNYYMCSLGELMKAALPSSLKLASETSLSLKPGYDASTLSSNELSFCKLLEQGKSYTSVQIKKLRGMNFSLRMVQQLYAKEVIELEQHMKTTSFRKKETFLQLSPSLYDPSHFTEACSQLKRARAQRELLESFFQLSKEEAKEIFSRQYIKHKLAASSAIIKSLVDRGLLLECSEEPLENQEKNEYAHALNSEQASALRAIKESWQERNCCLLHGVTGSGKTEVYIHLIQEQLSIGKQVLFLVPEIALTPQMTARLRRVFGDKLGVYHSRLTERERFALWKRQLDDKDAYPIILGARSAVFLPFSKLGLVLIDEEHEASYKQYEPNPRYNARDVAIVLASFVQARVLLGSATPSLESYYNAERGKYALVTLKSRHRRTAMPLVQTVDMKEAYRKKQTVSFFSKVLLEAIEKALEDKKQVILFQNRKGYSPFLSCKACGHVQKCKYCDVSLTYYKGKNQLACHYCGYSESRSKTCPECKEGELIYAGFGTEKVEEELLGIFPLARVQRMDLSTTRAKDAYENIIKKLDNYELDILIGTQMVAKGLDFSRLAVVGILNADNMLNHPDFRAYERGFQLMTQVSGRAGRSADQGLVILQTSDPTHTIIKQVIQHDYQAMFAEQIAERRLFSYPPYHRLIKISLKHRDARIVEHAMHLLAHQLRLVLAHRILGPQWPPVSRSKAWYVKVLLIKIEQEASLTTIKELIYKTWQGLKQDKKYAGVRSVFDVDPY